MDQFKNGQHARLQGQDPMVGGPQVIKVCILGLVQLEDDLEIQYYF